MAIPGTARHRILHLSDPHLTRSGRDEDGVAAAVALAWLGSLLARPAPAGSVVVLHHPPIGPGSSPLMGSVKLRNADRLAQVLSGSDVHAVLCGHFHLQLSGFLGSQVYQIDAGD
jgi:3',5'-cyclic AMP phosphodiesterase CpdA